MSTSLPQRASCSVTSARDGVVQQARVAMWHAQVVCAWDGHRLRHVSVAHRALQRAHLLRVRLDAQRAELADVLLP